MKFIENKTTIKCENNFFEKYLLFFRNDNFSGGSFVQIFTKILDFKTMTSEKSSQINQREKKILVSLLKIVIYLD